jgi:uncharacterized OsmC-like protein
MAAQDLSQAIERVRSVLARRPAAALHADEPAVAAWEDDTRVTVSHANATQISTDMPVEIGGAGNEVTPGWLLRASLASCLATRIAMEAAVSGVRIKRLTVHAQGTSDVRGLLGMEGASGETITAAPCTLELQVSLEAPAIPEAQLRALVDRSYRCSPVCAALDPALRVALTVEVAGG